MSEEKSLGENEFLFEGEIVKVHRFAESKEEKHLFEFRETMSEVIETINPKLYKKLYLVVSKFATKYDQIQKERQEAREKEEKEKKIEELKQFKQEFKKIAPKELMDREPEFKNPQNVDRWWGSVEIVQFHSKTSMSKRVELSREDERWIVEDDHYKKRRYKTLEKASARIIDLLDSYENIEKATNNRDQAIQDFATATGLVLEKGWHSSRYARRHSEGHTTYELVSIGFKKYEAPFALKMSVSYGNKCSIYAVEIKKPMTILDRVCQNIIFNLKESITDPEEVKKLASDITKAIKNMK